MCTLFWLYYAHGRLTSPLRGPAKFREEDSPDQTRYSVSSPAERDVFFLSSWKLIRFKWRPVSDGGLTGQTVKSLVRAHFRRFCAWGAAAVEFSEELLLENTVRWKWSTAVRVLFARQQLGEVRTLSWQPLDSAREFSQWD